MHAELCEYLLAPQSIAVIGASERNFYSRNCLLRLQSCGYTGKVFLVNPRAAPVFGRVCHARLADIGEPIEMAFIAVPRDAVMQALTDCAEVGVKAAVIVSTGFSESHDAEGRRLQEELSSFLARNPMAVCGPSCLGVINVHGKFQAFGGHTGTEILPGRIALVSQSGANVHSYVAAALKRNLGFSYIVSSGNEVGLEVTEYIEYFLRDPHTRVVCAYVENFATPEYLVRVARLALKADKPIIAIKIGRSESSSRAALAHTGAMTGSDQFFDTLFRQFGISRADTIEEALDRAAIFAGSEEAWWPRGARVGVVSISGGFAATFADLSRQYEFDVPALQQMSVDRLASVLPVHVSPQNPVDISTQVQRDRPNAWAETVDCMAADPAIDFVLDAEALMQSEERVRALLAVRERYGKPVLLASTSPHIPILDEGLKGLCRSEGLPVLAGVEACQRAIESAVKFRKTARDNASARSPTPLARPQRTVLHEVDARKLLGRYGIAGPRGELVATAAEAAAAAARIGGPVALKIVSSSITHRSDLGLIQLGVPLSEVLDAAAALEQRLPQQALEQREYRILVQEMVHGVAELFVGVTAPAGYRPMIVIGIGGIFVELLGDRSSRICPVDADEAGAMLRELRLFPALTGFRGRRQGDVSAAARAIVAMSDFAMAASEWLAEAEINPLIVLPEGQGVRAVDALIVARERESEMAVWPGASTVAAPSPDPLRRPPTPGQARVTRTATVRREDDERYRQ